MREEGRLPAATLFLLFLLGQFARANSASFGAATNYPVGTRPTYVLFGDLDGDQKIDLLVAHDGDPNVPGDGSVKLLLGNGDGTFKAALSVAENLNLGSVATADFNGDQRLDIVFAVHGDNSTGQNGSITVLLGNGDGTFRDAKTFQVEGDISSLAVGDFNSDLRPDLAVLVGFATCKLTIFPGNGDGSFGSGTYVLNDIQPNPQVLSGISSILVADFNSDHNVDLVMGLLDRLVILRGKGDGTFQPPIDAPGIQTTYSVVRPLPVSAADFNGDGKLDLSIWVGSGSLGGNTVRVQTLLGNDDGTLQPPVTVSADTQGLFPAVGDFNGDGISDLAITDAFLPAVNVHLGKGDGTFKSPLSLGANTYPFSVSVVDLNADRSPELVTTNGFDSAVAVLLNTTGADFDISASGLTPGTVSAGQSATSTISLDHLNTFGDTVTLGCSVQPEQSAPTCSLRPRSVTFDSNGQAAAIVTINTGAATARLRPSPIALSAGALAVLFPAAAGFMLMGSLARSTLLLRRKLVVLLVSGFLSCGIIFQAACGNGSGASSPHSTTYAITVSGTSGSTSHSTQISLNVR
jgi:hypothetical protein